MQHMDPITLHVMIRSRVHIATMVTNFLVVKTHCPYNAIIGQPMLNSLTVITSTYHLKMKFLRKTRVGGVCGETMLHEGVEGKGKDMHMLELPMTEQQALSLTH